MRNLVDEQIEAYAQSHASGIHDLYSDLRKETFASCALPEMQVGHVEGRLLKMLAQLIGARRAVEIGTFTGYSALCIAEGLLDDGTLITCDIDEKNTAIARRYFARVPWGKRIEVKIAPALDTLRALEGVIDFAFIDADKSNYIAYWEALVPRLRTGGLIVADNVLWSGEVLAPNSPNARAIAAFNDVVAKDNRTECVMLTVRDGITIARKK